MTEPDPLLEAIRARHHHIPQDPLPLPTDETDET